MRYLVMTRGDKGSDDPAADPAAIGRAREAEQRAAAAEIGVSGVEFLDEPDGQVEPGLRLRERVTFAIRSFRPEIVMTHDPTVRVRQQRVGQPSRSSRGGPGHGRRGLSRPRAIRSTFRSTSEAAWPPGRSPSSSCGAPTKRTRSSTSVTPSSARSRRWRTTQPVPRLRRDRALAAPPGGGARRAGRLSGSRGLPPRDAGPVTPCGGGVAASPYSSSLALLAGCAAVGTRAHAASHARAGSVARERRPP